MSLPKIVIVYGNGNLLQDIAAVDGIAGLVGSVATVGLKGVVNTVYNLPDAIDKGYTLLAEASMYRHIKEFYDEIGGNQELWIMGVDATMTLAEMLDNTDEAAAKKLVKAASGRIRILGITKNPPGGYDPGDDFMDADVQPAVIAGGVFAAARLTELQPLRVLVEGWVTDDTSGTIFAPNTAAKGAAGVVLGGSAADGSASVGTALGRACKYPAHVKIGKVANGPLSITQAYIGSKKISELSNLETLHDKGYISFMSYAQKAGFYFGIDHMASTDDYRLLAYGRVIDKAAVIAAAVYTEQIEGEVDVTPDGKIAELDLQHLQGLITKEIQIGMADQISSLDVYINPVQAVISTNKLNLKLKITPKGYTSEIEIEIGLYAPATS